MLTLESPTYTSCTAFTVCCVYYSTHLLYSPYECVEQEPMAVAGPAN